MHRLGPDLALVILRLAGVGLAVFHGWPKLVRMTAGDTRFVQGVGEMGFPWPTGFAWLSVLTEVVGGLFVFLGLGTRVAAALCAVNMVVAAFLRHHAHDLLLMRLGLQRVPEDVVRGWGNPELALLYLIPFAALALIGGGGLALERLAGRRGGGPPRRKK